MLATLSFLTDSDANNWARNCTERNKSAIAANLVPWTQFLAALDLYFKDPREAAHAAFIKIKSNTPARTVSLKVDKLRVKGDLTDLWQIRFMAYFTLYRVVPGDPWTSMGLHNDFDDL